MSTNPPDPPTTEAPLPPLQVRTRKRPPRPIILPDAMPSARSAATKPEPEVDFHLEGAQITPDIDTDTGVRARRQYNGAATKEFVMAEVLKMRLAGRHPDEIAKVFGVTPRTAWNWVRELKDAIATEARNIDPFPIIGEALRTFDDVRHRALQTADQPGIKPADKIKALAEARSSTLAKGQFLRDSGLFRVFTLQPSKATSEDAETTKADELKDLLRDMFQSARDFAAGDLEAKLEATDDEDGDE